MKPFSSSPPPLALTALLLGCCLPSAHAATFRVTSPDDSGPGTLRQAVDDANAAPGADIIEFALPGTGDGTISLTTSEPRASSALVLSGDVTINGPGADFLNVQRAEDTYEFRIFEVTAGVKATIRGLTIRNGHNPGHIIRMPSGQRPEVVRDPGGGIFNAGSLTLENCLLSDNRAERGYVSRGSEYDGGGNGGAIYSTGSLAITNCTFSANTAVHGGGIYGAATIVNSTFVGNAAGGIASSKGGAVWLQGASRITNATFSGNKALGSGNSLFNSGELEVSNTLFNDSGNGLASSGTFKDGGYNLAIHDGNGLLTAPTDKLKVDPLLGALASNGSTTPTLPLLAGSPAIDAGNTSLSTDQRGLPRPNGNGDDIGAFELHASLPPFIKALKLTPESPYTNDPISAETVVEDTSGKPVTLTYQWRRTRGSKTIVLPETGRTLTTAGDTVSLGDIVTVTVVASNGVSSSTPRSAGVKIENSPPNIISLSLRPKQPYTNEKMVATINATDPDKTRLLFTYIWTRNGVITQVVADTRNSQNIYDLKKKGNGDKGDVIELTATASDGEWSNVVKSSVTVRNSPPVLTSLTLAPQAPTSKQVVVANYAGHDDDGDAFTRIYKWRIGTKWLPEEKGSRLDLAKYPKVKAGDIITLEMRLSDGESLSKMMQAQVTVVAPAATSSPAS